MTTQGVPVAVEGIVNVKIADDEDSVRQAAQRFLDNQERISDIVRNVNRQAVLEAEKATRLKEQAIREEVAARRQGRHESRHFRERTLKPITTVGPGSRSER